MSVIADPIEFARDCRKLSGEVQVAALERLSDVVTDGSGSITWSVEGVEEEDGSGGRRRFLLLEAEGNLNLVCQRCLGALPWPLVLSSRLELMAPGQEWPEEELEDDSCDAIEATHDMDPVPLLEEEILLALPQAPRHDVCVPPAKLVESGADQSEKVSPFAVLAGLKKERR